MNLYALKIITQMSKQPGDFQVKTISGQINTQTEFILRNKNDQLHSLNSPAVFTIISNTLRKETISFSEVWFDNDKKHRLDGPADACYDLELKPIFTQYWHYGFRVHSPDKKQQ